MVLVVLWGGGYVGVFAPRHTCLGVLLRVSDGAPQSRVPHVALFFCNLQLRPGSALHVRTHGGILGLRVRGGQRFVLFRVLCVCILFYKIGSKND